MYVCHLIIVSIKTLLLWRLSVPGQASRASYRMHQRVIENKLKARLLGLSPSPTDYNHVALDMLYTSVGEVLR